MRIFLLSNNSDWSQGFSQLAQASGWSLATASRLGDFLRRFDDQTVDVLVAESLQDANVVDTLRQLRTQGSTCGVVWVAGESSRHTRMCNYAEFADRRVARHTPWIEWGAILNAQLGLLQRHGWR